MTSEPIYSDWQSLLALIKRAVESGQHEMLLTMMMTSDERDALISRANILCELLKGDLSQRQISQMLGVGVATITRGSNELKHCTEDSKQSLSHLLLEEL